LDADKPQQVNALDGKVITAIAGGRECSACLSSFKEVYCWGNFCNTEKALLPVPVEKSKSKGKYNTTRL
jgi:hypothetical protein